MSDDDSNDVVMVVPNGDGSNTGEGTSAETKNRPIMDLFQRLISNDNKQNTVLTNSQIISILLEEFNIDISTLHELEVDIYLNVVKRFLKDWPKWDEFDQGVNVLRQKNAYKSIKKTLESKYIDLKNYLRIQLDATKPLAQKAVIKLVKENAKRMEHIDTSDVTLEILCTRKQLNELILPYPNPGEAQNIFHLTEYQQTTIPLHNIPIESILNWWGVLVTVECKSISFSRETKHQLKHVLVNGKNGPNNVKRVLNGNVQVKDQKRSTDTVQKEQLYIQFNNLIQSQKEKVQLHMMMQAFINLIKDDFETVQDTGYGIPCPASYRQHSNEYPYYRKLRKEVEKNVASSYKYDFFIEETLAPLHVIQLRRVLPWMEDNQVTLTVECLECKVKFGCLDMCRLLKEHFDMYHAKEPDWTCSNCENTFSMQELTKCKWKHTCS